MSKVDTTSPLIPVAKDRLSRLQLLTTHGLIEGTEHLQRPLHIRDVTFRKASRSRPTQSRNLSLTSAANLPSEKDSTRSASKSPQQKANDQLCQLVTNCHQFKLIAADGKERLTDCATAETLLRLVQSVPAPKQNPSSSG